MKRILSLILTLVLAGSAFADTTVVEGAKTFGNITLKRGSTTVFAGAGVQNDCRIKAQTDAAGKADGTYAYTCAQTETDAFNVTESTACSQTQPADAGKTISCSNPYFGTRPITQAYTLHSAPTCWVSDGAITPPNDTVPPCTTTPPSGTYTTNFAVQENPLSEGGTWVHNGNSWTKVAVGPHGAHSTLPTNRGHDYDDSYAYLGNFVGANYKVSCTVYVKPGSLPDASREVELWLRASDDATHARGIEVTWSYKGAYVMAVQWNGAFGDFSIINEVPGPRPLVTGDVISATINGSVITTDLNGVIVNGSSNPPNPTFGTNGTYPSGKPGMGFDIDGSGGALNDDFGCSAFTATQLP